jgi:hypothetical protein
LGFCAACQQCSVLSACQPAACLLACCLSVSLLSVRSPAICLLPSLQPRAAVWRPIYGLPVCCENILNVTVFCRAVPCRAVSCSGMWTEAFGSVSVLQCSEWRGMQSGLRACVCMHSKMCKPFSLLTAGRPRPCILHLCCKGQPPNASYLHKPPSPKTLNKLSTLTHLAPSLCPFLHFPSPNLFDALTPSDPSRPLHSRWSNPDLPCRLVPS